MRVLLVRAGALGDLLLLRRAIAGLRRGGHEVGLLAPEGAGAALVGPGLSEARSLIRWEDPGLATLLGGGEPRHAFAEALAGFELAICYSRDAALGAALARLVPAVRCHPPLPPPGGPHVALWCLEPVRELVVDGPLPSLAPTARDSAEARALLGGLPASFPALHPGSGSAAKNWPLARFEALAREWGRRGAWLLVQGPADRERANVLRRIEAAVPAASLAPRTLAAILAQAGVYVGNDSGVTHLAAATGAPTLALFGPTDPAVWAPIGERVRVLRGDGASLETLTLDTVRAAVSALRGARGIAAG